MIIVMKPQTPQETIDGLLGRIESKGLKPLHMPGAERVVLGARGDERVLAELQLEADPQSVQRALAAGITGRYSKATEHAYGPTDRQADLNAARERFSDEFNGAMRFARGLLERYPLLHSLERSTGL